MDLKAAYRLYQRADALAAYHGWDGPFRVSHENEILAMAEASLAAEMHGDVKPMAFVVVPHQDEEGTWTYRAVDPSTRPDGCRHEVMAPDVATGAGMVLTEHQERCMRRNCSE